MEYLKLYRLAEEMVPKAYAPYSGFCVGAALLTESGEIFTGVNIENASYGATLCAERAAFAKAITDGHRTFKAIAIASSGGEAYPCGICRQFIFQFGSDIDIITAENEDELHTAKISELLPHGFRL